MARLLPLRSLFVIYNCSRIIGFLFTSPIFGVRGLLLLSLAPSLVSFTLPCISSFTRLGRFTPKSCFGSTKKRRLFLSPQKIPRLFCALVRGACVPSPFFIGVPSTVVLNQFGTPSHFFLFFTLFSGCVLFLFRQPEGWNPASLPPLHFTWVPFCLLPHCLGFIAQWKKIVGPLRVLIPLDDACSPLPSQSSVIFPTRLGCAPFH